MTRHPSHHWLRAEITRWREEGLIAPEVAGQLMARYPDDRSGSRSLGPVLLGVLGALLVGGGVILLLAHNWSDLSRPVRACLSVLPMLSMQLLAGWVLARKPGSAAWREPVAVGWVLSVAAGIALVAQTYHMPGSFDTFLLTWMLLSLPVVYLLRSVAAWLLVLVGCTVWAVSRLEAGGPTPVAGLPLLALVPMMLVWHLRDARGAEATLARWGMVPALPIAMVGMVWFGHGLGWVLFYTGYAAAVFLIGRVPRESSRGIRHSPGVLLGGLGLAGVMLVYSFLEPWEEGFRQLSGRGYGAAVHGISLGLLIGLGAVVAWLLVTAVRRRDGTGLLWGGVPLLMAVGFVVRNELSPDAAMWLVNAYAFASGMAMLINGVRNDRLGSLNTGMLLATGLVVIRFFDGGYPILVRATVFILAGLGLLGINLWMARRRTGRRT